MDIIKDIASVIGLILSCITLLTLCSKTGKSFLASIFKKYNKESDNDIESLKESIANINNQLSTLIEDFNKFKEESTVMNETSLEFMKQQCRNIIKSIFYSYYDTKVLPLYEYKTLIYIKQIYVDRLKGNSYAATLLKEMETWEIDYKSNYIEED